MDIDGHSLHAIHALEAVRRLDRLPAAMRCCQKDPRLVDRLAEDRPERLRAARREARAERETFHHEHDGLYLTVAPTDPPARALDLRLIDVGERVRRQESVALEELARLVGGRVWIDLDFGKRRGRGHRSSFKRTKRASAGRYVKSKCTAFLSGGVRARSLNVEVSGTG